jgi:ankyrin repeat protein
VKLKSNNDIVTIVRFPVLLLLLALLQPSTVAAAADARAAVLRSLPVLQRSAATFTAKRACMSCHHNALAVMTLRLADRRGMAVDQAVLAAVEARTFRELRSENALDDAVQAVSVADPTPNDSLLLMAAHDAGLPGDTTTAVYARRLARWQRADGRWVTSDFRPPHSSSQFTATATAIRALRDSMPEELAAERDSAIKRGAAWLVANWPRTTEDAAFRLMGLVWAGAAREDVDSARRQLLSLQLPAGGWPQLSSYPADAYSTGEALYALRLAGMPAAEHEWQRGERFLLATQAADGTWHVRSRMLSPAEVSPPYFNTGFPYGKDEFLSYAGSAWAVSALLLSLPEGAPRMRPATVAPRTAAPAWLRTALFGSVGELRLALEAGLDPASTTAGGTTLLMAAALDAGKTHLLLARGADPKARGRGRADALTIAASHLGAADSIGALLDAGAEPQPPDDVRVRRTALVAASMAGDVDSVRLLLQHGAPPAGEALSEAITFGHADVVRLLVDAGADVQGVDSSGINLLHWAAITNRAAVIPILARARVPINALDDAGFTPLMYAATIDQGDQETLAALLEAGADPKIRNDAGRTPLQQAERLKHADAVRLLRRR